MGIKSANNNWFGTRKWFGCILKDQNSIDKHTTWSYDVKQFPVDTDGHLNSASATGDVMVLTNPYATSAAVVAAVSGVFKYHTHYDDGSGRDLSAMSSGRVVKVTMYAEASAMTSSIPSTKYINFPYIASGDWLHYAKGKTNYGLAGSSVFDAWGYDSEVLAEGQSGTAFSSTPAHPTMFMASSRVTSSDSNHGVNWIDNYPRLKSSPNQNGESMPQECFCCWGWRVEMSNSYPRQTLLRITEVPPDASGGGGQAFFEFRGGANLKAVIEEKCWWHPQLDPCEKVERLLTQGVRTEGPTGTATPTVGFASFHFRKYTPPSMEISMHTYYIEKKEMDDFCGDTSNWGPGLGVVRDGPGQTPGTATCGKHLQFQSEHIPINGLNVTGRQYTMNDLRLHLGLPRNADESASQLLKEIHEDGGAMIQLARDCAEVINKQLGMITIDPHYKC